MQLALGIGDVETEIEVEIMPGAALDSDRTSIARILI